MNKELDVVCVGQALLDCIVRGKEDLPYKKNVYRAEEILLRPGGDALNEAFVLAKDGFRVAVVCGLGDDVAGRTVKEELALRSVCLDAVKTDPSLTTPIAHLTVAKDGSRISVNSAATMLPGYRPDTSLFPKARIISFASLFRAPLDDPEVIVSLIRAAKEAGAIVCADAKLPTFRTVTLNEIRDVLPLVDYFFPNENEAAFYTGKATFDEMGAELRATGIRNVIIKAGPDGCYVYPNEGGSFHLPALPVKVIDTTGAGDAFVAGFYEGLLAGCDLKEAAKSGLEKAALKIS